MGLLDKVKGLAKKNDDKVIEGLEKVGDIVEKKVGAEHGAKVESAVDRAKDAVDKLDGKVDRTKD